MLWKCYRRILIIFPDFVAIVRDYCTEKSRFRVMLQQICTAGVILVLIMQQIRKNYPYLGFRCYSQRILYGRKQISGKYYNKFAPPA